MRVAVPVESMRRATAAAIAHAAIWPEPSMRVARHLCHGSGTAVTPPHKAHRYRAGRGGTHHGQDDAARAFHMARPWGVAERPIVSHPGTARQVKAGPPHGIVQAF